MSRLLTFVCLSRPCYLSVSLSLSLSLPPHLSPAERLRCYTTPCACGRPCRWWNGGNVGFSVSVRRHHDYALRTVWSTLMNMLAYIFCKFSDHLRHLPNFINPCCVRFDFLVHFVDHMLLRLQYLFRLCRKYCRYRRWWMKKLTF